MAIISIESCGIMDVDGNSDTPIISQGSYFYLLERSTSSLIMLDYQLKELQRWDLSALYNETSLQGITFDGTYLWISQAGNADKIIQLDISGSQPSVMNSFNAPPDGQGTIRDLAWDGAYLWAINSGSSTNGTAATLYKLNPADGSVLLSYVLSTPEPRALTYSDAIKNIYGSGIDAALYFTDTDKDMVYSYRIDRPCVDTLFSTPTPPRGAFTKYPAGLACDGSNFWLVNSSDVSDLLYKINSSGAVLERYNLPYDDPGPIVWASSDLRTAVQPKITSISPSTAELNTTFSMTVYGSAFRMSGEIAANLGDGITINSISVVSQTQLTLDVTVAAGAELGKRNLTITFSGSLSATAENIFEVVEKAVTPYLWAADLASYIIYKVNLDDETYVQYNSTDITSTGVQGLAYDGSDIWLCASGTDRHIYKVTYDGTNLYPSLSYAFPASGGTMRGMAFNDGYLWLALSISSGSSGKIYKINPQTGALIDSLNSPGKEPRGITFANGTLYCNDTSLDSVYSYNKTSGSWKSVFRTPLYSGSATSTLFATGMTFDGENFWIANSSGDYDYIYEVNSAGEILRTISAPNKGTAQITGIVYQSK